MYNAIKYFKWSSSVEIKPLHFILPFFPKKNISKNLIKKDLAIGKILKPMAFDIIITGKK